MITLIKDILDTNGKINIPEFATKVKLDIGTSLSAPNSEVWLQRENNLCVFGFEPNIHNVKILYEGQNYWPYHIKFERIGTSFFCLNYALSNIISEKEKFYCTDGGNSGTSSLFQPRTFEVVDVIDVPVITLEHFFDFFPWEKIPYIDQVKIDAQSSDFNIIKGMGKYLTERIVYLDVETHTNNQYHSNETPMQIKQFLEEQNFECLSWGINATFLNKSYKDITDKINYFILKD